MHWHSLFRHHKENVLPNTFGAPSLLLLQIFRSRRESVMFLANGRLMLWRHVGQSFKDTLSFIRTGNPFKGNQIRKQNNALTRHSIYSVMVVVCDKIGADYAWIQRVVSGADASVDRSDSSPGGRDPDPGEGHACAAHPAAGRCYGNLKTLLPMIDPPT